MFGLVLTASVRDDMDVDAVCRLGRQWLQIGGVVRNIREHQMVLWETVSD
jgi:hypothetical protein